MQHMQRMQQTHHVQIMKLAALHMQGMQANVLGKRRGEDN